MGRFIVRERGVDGIELVIDFEGTMMQFAQKVTAKVYKPPPPPPPKPKSKSGPGSPMKGVLKPYKGQTPSSVMILRALLDGKEHGLPELISAAQAGPSHLNDSSIRQALHRIRKHKYVDCREEFINPPDSQDYHGFYTITERGRKALLRFEEDFPAHAPKADQPEQSTEY